jgi:hypothetical protein
MSEENKRVTRSVLDELFDKGNMDAADELIHPDFVNYEAPLRCGPRSTTRSARATRSSPA